MVKTSMHHRRSHCSQGFTLIELLVTIAIAAILMALAVPSVKTMLARNTFSSIGGEFKGSLQRARNEATTKNACLTVCRSTNTADDEPLCSTSGTDWQVGWIAFYEDSCDTAKLKPVTTDGAYAADKLIMVRQPGNPNYSITPKNGETLIQFSPLGRTNLSGSRKFTLASTDTAMSTDYGYAMCLDMLGSTRTIKSGSDC